MPMVMMVGKGWKYEYMGKWAYFISQCKRGVNPLCVGHPIVRIFCVENFPSIYSGQIHWLDLRENFKGKSWGFRSRGMKWGAGSAVSILID